MGPWDEQKKDDQFPARWLYERLNTLEEKMDAQHGRTRIYMDAQFGKLHDRLDKHQEEDEAVERRVFKMETERDIERGQVAKRSSWISLGVAAFFNAAIAVGKWLADTRQ